MSVSRRELLGLGAAAGLGLLGSAFLPEIPFTETAAAASKGYGPLVDHGDLQLPRGFRCVRFGRAGTSLSDGARCPGAHDGMGRFGRGRVVTLVRNQEFDDSTSAYVAIDGAAGYDRAAPGGVTITRYDVDRSAVLESFVALTGTLSNCGGGVTPWGSWLTCEETTDGPNDGWTRPHGYVFEVPADATGPVQATPLRALGRFEHEAAVVDPRTGHIYMTEDNGNPGDGFYRYVPDHPLGSRSLRAGRLQMLVVQGRQGYDTASGQEVGAKLPTRWVDIDDPDPADAGHRASAVYDQGAEKGAARFLGNEGAFWARGAVWFSASDGGDDELGQVWRYAPDPHHNDRGELELVYESTKESTLFNPDAIAVSPRGGVLIAEDGDGEDTPNGKPNFLKVLTPRGAIEDFCRPLVQLDLHAHNIDGDPDEQQPPGALGWSEFAGPCWSADGTWLFVNLQYPGATYAITGPWQTGWL